MCPGRERVFCCGWVEGSLHLIWPAWLVMLPGPSASLLFLFLIVLTMIKSRVLTFPAVIAVLSFLLSVPPALLSVFWGCVISCLHICTCYSFSPLSLTEMALLLGGLPRPQLTLLSLALSSYSGLYFPIVTFIKLYYNCLKIAFMGCALCQLPWTCW